MDIVIGVVMISTIVLIGVWVVRSARADDALDKTAARVDEIAERAEALGERKAAELRQAAIDAADEVAKHFPARKR